jgi:hypothetical protein
MFRHYRVILREQGIDHKLPDDEKIVSKHVGVW